MSREIVQLKLTSGEEVIAERLSPSIYNNVMLIERNTFTNHDEYSGEITGTSIFYVMRSWMLHQFNKRDGEFTEFNTEINPRNILGIYSPHPDTIDQYQASVKQFMKNGEFGDEPDDGNDLDSDWGIQPYSNDSDNVDMQLLQRLKTTSRLN